MAPSLTLFGWTAQKDKEEREKCLIAAAKQLGWLTLSRKFGMLCRAQKNNAEYQAIISSDHQFVDEHRAADKAAAAEALKASKEAARVAKRAEKAAAKADAAAAKKAGIAPKAASKAAGAAAAAGVKRGPKAKKAAA